MNQVQLQVQKQALSSMLGQLERITVSCRSCQHFADGATCALAEAAPPADVQAVGCDEWAYDQVPF